MNSLIKALDEYETLSKVNHLVYLEFNKKEWIAKFGLFSEKHFKSIIKELERTDYSQLEQKYAKRLFRILICPSGKYELRVKKLREKILIPKVTQTPPKRKLEKAIAYTEEVEELPTPSPRKEKPSPILPDLSQFVKDLGAISGVKIGTIQVQVAVWKGKNQSAMTILPCNIREALVKAKEWIAFFFNQEQQQASEALEVVTKFIASNPKTTLKRIIFAAPAKKYQILANEIKRSTEATLLYLKALDHLRLIKQYQYGGQIDVLIKYLENYPYAFDSDLNENILKVNSPSPFGLFDQIFEQLAQKIEKQLSLVPDIEGEFEFTRGATRITIQQYITTDLAKSLLQNVHTNCDESKAIIKFLLNFLEGKHIHRNSILFNKILLLKNDQSGVFSSLIDAFAQEMALLSSGDVATMKKRILSAQL